MALERVPDLDSLALLLEVAATGSLGRAAAAHGLSQPAVSARVQAVERLVGFPLLVRGARGSTLTPQGALLADWARGVLGAAAVLDAGIASLRGDLDARLQVAASLTVAEHLLPGWLVRLAAARPDTAVSLTASNSADVAVAVLGGQVELGFVEGPDLPGGLQEQVVGADRLVVVVPPSHPWSRRRRPVEVTELAATRLVQREPTSGTRTALEHALAGLGPLAAPLLELSTSSGVRAAVAAGAGPAVLSDLAVSEDLAAGRLVQVPLRGVGNCGPSGPWVSDRVARPATSSRSPRRTGADPLRVRAFTEGPARSEMLRQGERADACHASRPGADRPVAWCPQGRSRTSSQLGRKPDSASSAGAQDVAVPGRKPRLPPPRRPPEPRRCRGRRGLSSKSPRPGHPPA